MADDTTRTQPPEPDGFTRTFTGAGATASFAEQATSSLDAARPEIPGYDLEQIVGRGGMGLVYRGRQLSTNRTVAVKLMIAGELAGESARARFRLEAENTAKLSHPNIVQLYEAGEAGGRAFFSCEFMAGGSLANKLDGAPWDGVRAAGMVVDLARAVAAAHAAGIVHRDLKPANVLLSAGGSPKIADFGIAKSLDSDSHTNTGAILGTPSYMPPEQAGGAKAVGPAADVYSLGAILYELVAGRPPFRGADFVETIDQVRNQEPVPPRALNPKLPRDVETIALKCLQKEPAKRYASALALADDLERFLAGRPIAARPVGGFERAWRWAKRSPAIASLLALTFVLFAAGTAVSAYFAIQANAAREKAESREGDANRARNEADARAAELLVEREKADHLLYISQMNHAQIAYRDQSTARLSELLDLTRPDPGKTDYRNWEWHFLHRQTYSWNAETIPDVAALPRSKGPRSAPSGVAGFGGGGQYYDLPFLTADGTRIAAPPATSPLVVGLASLEDGGTFDAKTGKLIAAYRPLGVDSSQAFGASADGRFVVLREVKTNREGLPAEFVCRVVDRVSGTDLMPPRRGKLPMIPNVNADGTRVMIAYANYEGPGGEKPKSVPIEIWEPGTGFRKLEMPIPDGLHADVPIFGPSGRIALMPCGASPMEGPLSAVRTTLVVQDLTTTPKAIKTIALPNSMQSARFSPSGTCFMIHAPPEILVHSSATGEKLGSWTAPNPYWPATVSDDGRTVVLAGNGSIIHVARNVVDSRWRVSTLRGPSAYSHPNSLGTYWCSPDGSELVAVRLDGKLYRWNLRSPPGYSTAWPAALRKGGAESYAVPSRFGERVLFHSFSADRVTGRISLGLHDPVAGSTRWGEASDTVNYESIEHMQPDGSRIVARLTTKKDESRWEIRSLAAAGTDRLSIKVVAGGALPPDLSLRTSLSGAWLIEPLADAGPSRGHGIVPGFRIRDGTDGAVKIHRATRRGAVVPSDHRSRRPLRRGPAGRRSRGGLEPITRDAASLRYRGRQEGVGLEAARAHHRDHRRNEKPRVQPGDARCRLLPGRIETRPRRAADERRSAAGSRLRFRERHAAAGGGGAARRAGRVVHHEHHRVRFRRPHRGGRWPQRRGVERDRSRAEAADRP